MFVPIVWLVGLLLLFVDRFKLYESEPNFYLFFVKSNYLQILFIYQMVQFGIMLLLTLLVSNGQLMVLQQLLPLVVMQLQQVLLFKLLGQLFLDFHLQEAQCPLDAVL